MFLFQGIYLIHWSPIKYLQKKITTKLIHKNQLVAINGLKKGYYLQYQFSPELKNFVKKRNQKSPNEKKNNKKTHNFPQLIAGKKIND